MDLEEKTCNSKDDIDLGSLLNHMENGNNEKLSHHSTQNSCETEELLVLHGSNESLGSNEDDQQDGTKPNFFDKQFLKTLPMAILAKRKIFGSTNELSVPATNTFHSMPGTPRLPRGSGSFTHKKADRLSAKAPRNGVKKMTWNVWISDSKTSKEVTLPRSHSCAHLLHAVLTELNRGTDLTQWSIIEQISEEMIERFVEDFETLEEVNPNREPSNQISRFCLNRTPLKYMILDKPEQCLPPDMLTYPPGSAKLDDKVSEQDKRRQLQDILTKTAPEMCGWLHVRDLVKKSWKKVYCVLRNSGFYYSNKNSNKEQQHLVCVAEIHKARVWFPINNKKLISHSPTPHCFCLKARTTHRHDAHESTPHWFCAETPQLKIAWINGLRLTLNGNKFHECYFSAQNHEPSILTRFSSDRSVKKSENSNFVPMDFSGSRGRVIKDPLEVAMVEMEHQTSWKRRLKHRISNASASLLGGSAPSKSSGFLTRSIHKTQPWFYGKISREAAAEEIQKHGSLDGTFLLRESRTIPGSVVITLCFGQKSRHIPVTFIEKNGQLYYTCDNGETRFQDLIQLVDFHRLNKGSLPCPLLHECISK